MSQNRTREDVQGVIAGLADPNDPHANPKVAEIVTSRQRK